MQFRKFYREYARLAEYAQSLFLLAARLVVAYGFSEAARMKWEAMPAVIEWFGSLGYPFPAFLAYLVSSVEVVGIVLLSFGLLTRFIAVPLMIIMSVAILTVHLPHGFESVDNGFEIPLYYLIFLGLLLAFGAGRYSVDRVVFKESPCRS